MERDRRSCFRRLAGPGKSILSWANVLKTDAVEAERLTGEEDRHAPRASWPRTDRGEVLLTYNGGVLVCHDGVIDEVPLMPREVRGRSGRGDTCTAAYMSRRLTIRRRTRWHGRGRSPA